MLLAQAAAAAHETSNAGIWIAGLFAAAGGVPGLIAVFSVFATRRDVESMERRVTKAEETLESIRTEIHEAERRLNAGSESRAKDTHDRINQVLESLADLRGRFSQDHGK